MRPSFLLPALALLAAPPTGAADAQAPRVTKDARGDTTRVPVVGSRRVVNARSAELARWERQAARVSITRDRWGIAHVHGASDADAVFGAIYAQAEDDFARVETNYLNALGRLAEVEGEGEIYRDLRMKLFVHPDTLRARHAASPAWLRTLMAAWADGLNYYLHTHPRTTPRLLTRFEPWMALAFTEGSIGGDISGISLAALEAFYAPRSGAPRTDAARPGAASASDAGAARARLDREPRGSNGIAVAPALTERGRALLLVNPHTSFFFRSELQMTSDEGLDAYGAVTWGQFFVYQGFNRRLGWMHTTSTADAVDEYAETVTRRGDGHVYRHGGAERPVTAERIVVPYRTPAGRAERTFTVYRTHHGPVVREADGRWITVRLMDRPIEALTQSWRRTTARDLAGFREVMRLAANTSNNTVYADADGTIGFFLPQFIPRRDDRFDWTRPVDGSDPATEWQGVHALEETPHVVNPPIGWIQNTNNWPYSVSGPDSPKRAAFPRYMDVTGENARGVHALRLLGALSPERRLSLDGLVALAYDPWLPAFETILPGLLAAYDALPADDPRRARLGGPIEALRGWDRRWGVASVPTALAVYWGEELMPRVGRGEWEPGETVFDHVARRVPGEPKLAALASAVERLERDFGTWRTPWGEINRFQRLTADLVHPFSDAGASIPVGFTSAQWGSLASFGARRYPGTRRMYGTSGNSFVAVVEFGPDGPRARAVSAGGESGDPASPHFVDQAERYATGNLREVWFTPAAVAANAVRTYRPGR